MSREKSSTHAIDTNVLIYAFDAHNEKKHSVARRIVTEAFDGIRTLIVTNQILGEFVSAATNKLKPALSKEEITRFLRSVKCSENWQVVDYSTEEVIAAVNLGKPFWDSVIAATLQPLDVELLTENTKHFAHTRLTAVNPFSR